MEDIFVGLTLIGLVAAWWFWKKRLFVNCSG